jgi:hypothetical protein
VTDIFAIGDETMTTPARFGLALVLIVTPLAVSAQASTTAPTGTRREVAAERRDAVRRRQEARLAMTPEQRAIARSRREARFANLPSEQQDYLRALRRYQGDLRTRARELQAQVAAGALTRDAMAQQLKAYRDANRPTRPTNLPERSRP